MWSLAWPWALLALPLPWLMRRLLPEARGLAEAGLRVPSLSGFETLRDRSGAEQMLNWRFWVAVLAWCLLVLAAARPERVGNELDVPVAGRNLMLAVDLSGSMDQKDFELAGRRVDRLTATKAVASDFIARRDGDRIGLILFGERAYLQVPLTLDRDTVRTLLLEAEIGLAGEKTAIGDAIALAAARLSQAAPDPAMDDRLNQLEDLLDASRFTAAASFLKDHEGELPAALRDLAATAQARPILDRLRSRLGDLLAEALSRAETLAAKLAVAGDLLRHAFHLIKDPCGLDHRHPLFGVALTLTHAGFEGLLGHGLVRKDADPDFSAAFDVAGHGDTGRLDLAGSEPSALDRLQGGQVASRPALRGAGAQAALGGIARFGGN